MKGLPDYGKQSVWEEHHRQRRFLPKYPAEPVIRYAFAYLSPKNDGALAPFVLDNGCGGGRHAAFLAREGYRVAGCDFSQSGLDASAALLAAEGLTAEFCFADARELPFEDDSFDGVVAFGSLYYMDYTGIKASVAEVFRVLKPGGSCLIYMRSDRDYRCGRGTQIDGITYILDTPETSEAGMACCFLAKKDIDELFHPFADLIVDSYEFTTHQGSVLNSDWSIVAVKES